VLRTVCRTVAAYPSGGSIVYCLWMSSSASRTGC